MKLSTTILAVPVLWLSVFPLRAESSGECARVIYKETPLRVEPTNESKVVTVLPSGTRVRTSRWNPRRSHRGRKQWVHVRLMNRPWRSGFLLRSALADFCGNLPHFSPTHPVSFLIKNNTRPILMSKGANYGSKRATLRFIYLDGRHQDVTLSSCQGLANFRADAIVRLFGGHPVLVLRVNSEDVCEAAGLQVTRIYLFDSLGLMGHFSFTGSSEGAAELDCIVEFPDSESSEPNVIVVKRILRTFAPHPDGNTEKVVNIETLRWDPEARSFRVQ